MAKKTKKSGTNEKNPATKTNIIENNDQTVNLDAAEKQGPIAFEFTDDGAAYIPPQEVGPDDQTELSEEETEAFAEAEKVIEKGLDTFVEVGTKLREIHKNRWYREKYSSFEKYCLSRWSISRSHA